MLQTSRNPFLRIIRTPVGWALALLALLPLPAHAQATITVEAGVDGYYRGRHWIPVQVLLTNQGQPVRLEARARFATGEPSPAQYRLAPRQLGAGANERHVLYARAPHVYSGASLLVDEYRDGRKVTEHRPRLIQVDDQDWLVVAVGEGDSTVKILTTLRLSSNQLRPTTEPWMRGSGNQGSVQVGSLAPARLPDRWQGLESVDMLVLGSASERDFSPDQLQALREYVVTGGHLVVTGGVNWNRLTTEFFQGLLPVQVTGSQTLTSIEGLRRFAGRPGPARTPFAATAGPLRPGAQALLEQGGQPLAASIRRGSGRVSYLAFDPSASPFRNWDGNSGLWRALLLESRPEGMVAALRNQSNELDEFWGATPAQGSRLTHAPFAISQLDVPAFYVVALFLLAYVIVLVPINYSVLKRLDRREYAWLTTPLIVVLFSVLAYLIGYGTKGGRVLVSRVAVIEAYPGQTMAPTVAYAGIFSPHKSGYDVRVAESEQRSSFLLSEPRNRSQGLQVVYEDQQQVRDFSVDMWSMRVLHADGVVRLDRGFTADLTKRGAALSGEVTNGTPLALEDCRLMLGSRAIPVDDLPAGGSVRVEAEDAATEQWAQHSLLASLSAGMKGDEQEKRMKQAVLRPLLSSNNGTSVWPATQEPILVGWSRTQVPSLEMGRNQPREVGLSLVVVHLGRE